MRLDYGKILMWSAILVSMPRWAGAFISADVSQMPAAVNEALHYANLVAGFGMGFLEVLAAAYMLDAWGKMKPKKTWNAKSYDHRWKILTGFVAGLFLLMPAILAPYIVSRMTGVTIGEALAIPVFRYIWSISVVLSPVFIVGGVAVASGNLVADENATVAQRNATQPHATAQPNVATQYNGATSKQQLMMQHWRPGMGPTELAELAGVHKSTASRYINNGAEQNYKNEDTA